MIFRCLPLALILVLLVGCKDTQQQQQPAQKIRIVSWNLAWFPGKNDNATEEEAKAHMQEAQAAIKELKPDILLLQEVRDWQAAEELCSVVLGLQVHVVSRFQPRPRTRSSPQICQWIQHGPLIGTTATMDHREHTRSLQSSCLGDASSSRIPCI